MIIDFFGSGDISKISEFSDNDRKADFEIRDPEPQDGR